MYSRELMDRIHSKFVCMVRNLSITSVPGRGGWSVGTYPVFSGSGLCPIPRDLCKLGLPSGPTESGVYLTLKHDGKVIRSETNPELVSYLRFIDNAEGDVLLVGLNLGTLVKSLTHSEEVTSVTVLESDSDLIDLILPFVRDEKLTVIQSDISSYNTSRRFDTIYIDSWGRKCYNTAGEIRESLQKLKAYLKNDNSWIGAWLEEIILATCSECGELVDECACSRCPICDQLIEECECDVCSSCGLEALECSCSLGDEEETDEEF